MTTDYVTINVRIKDTGDGALAETLWAQPVLATDFGGDYRLFSDMFFAPLRRGDVVRCEVTADGSLQVVDIRQILPGLLMGFEHPRGDDATVKRVLQKVRMLGHEVSRPVDGSVEVFVPGGELDRDIRFPRLPASWVRCELLDGPFRMRAIMEQVDFTLGTDLDSSADSLEHREPGHPGWKQLEPELVLPD